MSHKILFVSVAAGLGILVAVGGGTIAWIASMAPAKASVEAKPPDTEPAAKGPFNEESRNRLRGIVPGRGSDWIDSNADRDEVRPRGPAPVYFPGSVPRSGG